MNECHQKSHKPKASSFRETYKRNILVTTNYLKNTLNNSTLYCSNSPTNSKLRQSVNKRIKFNIPKLPTTGDVSLKIKTYKLNV